MACASVVEIVEQVIEGTLRCGFAIVRPPGHHADPDAGYLEDVGGKEEEEEDGKTEEGEGRDRENADEEDEEEKEKKARGRRRRKLHPCHHALGFCFFNNVAIAAKKAITDLGVSRIMIVDWDVHFGNGTEAAFRSDPNVLYFSVHRHDQGAFFPCMQDRGGSGNVGEGEGKGRTINVAFNGKPGQSMGDAEYAAV